MRNLRLQLDTNAQSLVMNLTAYKQRHTHKYRPRKKQSFILYLFNQRIVKLEWTHLLNHKTELKTNPQHRMRKTATKYSQQQMKRWLHI